MASFILKGLVTIDGIDRLRDGNQRRAVSDTLSNWFWESPTTEDKNLRRHLRSFPIKKSNQMASRLTATTSFPRVFFQLLQFSRQCPSFSANRAALMTKTDLIFQAFSSRFLNFAVQCYFCCRRHSSQVWQWRDFPLPIAILCYAQ